MPKRMPAPGISIVIPTLGRPSLKHTLDSLTSQISSEDEVIVVHEPADAVTPDICKAYPFSLRVISDATPGLARWGYKARRFGMQLAGRSWIHVIGDDDVYLPNALQAVRGSLTEPIPVMFRMQRRAVFNDVLWSNPELRCGNVAGEMIVFPNAPEKFGVFAECYEGDWFFISGLVANYAGRLKWDDTVICCWRA
jgi:glycosyltransferase involved in cell wall biosynthesis